MVTLSIAYLSICSYPGQVRYLREGKSYLFYLHVTSKKEIQICSNTHETGLVCVVYILTLYPLLCADKHFKHYF